MTETTFDAAVEQTPPWVFFASGAVVVVSVLAAIGLAPLWAIVPFLALSSMRHRLRSSSVRIDVREDTLAIGERLVPRAEIIDGWLDEDRDAPRVIVAFGSDVEIVSLRFETAIDARRFRDALAPPEDQAVCGARPRLVDALASLRFLAIAGAFFATGSRSGLLVLVFFALDARSVLRMRQVIATTREFTVRGPLRARTYAHANVARVEVDDGIVQLKDGTEIDVPVGSLRDATMASPAWLNRARTRVFEVIRS